MRWWLARFLVLILVGYGNFLTLQQWMLTGATADLLLQTALCALATLLTLYVIVAVP
jgi:hypothetical protein